MVRIKGEPPEWWKNQLGKAIVWSSWKGKPYVRSKGYPKPRTRSPEELETIANFTANSVAFKDRDPTSDDALNAMASGSQKRPLDIWMGLAVGSVITYLDYPIHPDSDTTSMFIVPLFFSTSEGVITINVNNASGRTIGGVFIPVPFNITSFNRMRLQGWANSTEATRTVTVRIVKNFDYNQPLIASGGDLVYTNSFAYLDTGAVAINPVPTTYQVLAVAMKGSNGTVDLTNITMAVTFWWEN